MKILLTLFVVIIFGCAHTYIYSQTTFTQRLKAKGSSFGIYDFSNAANGDYLSVHRVTLQDSIMSSHICCTRINKNGKIVWQKILNTGYNDLNIRLLGTSDNGLLLFLRANSYPIYNYSAFLIKCDSSGKKEWAKKLTGKSRNTEITPGNIIEDSKGNFVLLYDIDYHSGSHYDQTKIQIAKFDSSGNLLSQSGYENLYNENRSQNLLSQSIAETSEEVIYLA